MGYQSHLNAAQHELETALRRISDEIRDYPTPISGCDAQFNHLVGLRGSISEALRTLEAPQFVATPRTPEPMAGVESR